MKALAAILDYEKDGDDLPPPRERRREERGEAVIGAAVLVATAFRLRDESSLVFALRRLADAVASFEEEQIAA